MHGTGDPMQDGVHVATYFLWAGDKNAFIYRTFLWSNSDFPGEANQQYEIKKK